MAKGSVRKIGKKWYYRYYVENESGKLVQKECVGTESKSETEGLLRKAMEDYEQKKFVAKPENYTLGDLLDIWVEEELKPGTLSNGTTKAYELVAERIKTYPIGKRRLKTITAEHLQAFIDHLLFGGTQADGTIQQPLSRGYMRSFCAVLQNAFRFAVFPKRMISFNPMQYVVLRGKKEEVDIFSDAEDDSLTVPVLSHENYRTLMNYLDKKKNPAKLPIQIAYYTGLRIGEVCGLTWQDINLKDQYLVVRRSVSYNGRRHAHEIGTTKRSKVRTVDFCDTLADILRTAKKEQARHQEEYGEMYRRNYYKEVIEKSRTYYEVNFSPVSQPLPEGCREINFVCRRDDGQIEWPNTIGLVCRAARKKIPGLEDFHFHQLRHTFTSNLLSGGAAPKDVQELLGHSDVSTTMNIYAHSPREAKKSAARLLDQVAGE